MKHFKTLRSQNITEHFNDAVKNPDTLLRRDGYFVKWVGAYKDGMDGDVWKKVDTYRSMKRYGVKRFTKNNVEDLIKDKLIKDNRKDIWISNQWGDLWYSYNISNIKSVWKIDENKNNNR